MLPEKENLQAFQQIHRLLEVGRHFMDFSIIDSLIHELDLRPRETMALMRLYWLTLKRPEGVIGKELTTEIKLSQTATSMLIRNLLDKGHLSCHINPQDRRERLFTLSESTRPYFDRLADEQGRSVRAKLSQLPAEKQEALHHFIDEMQSLLQDSMQSSSCKA